MDLVKLKYLAPVALQVLVATDSVGRTNRKDEGVVNLRAKAIAALESCLTEDA